MMLKKCSHTCLINKRKDLRKVKAQKEAFCLFYFSSYTISLYTHTHYAILILVCLVIRFEPKFLLVINVNKYAMFDPLRSSTYQNLEVNQQRQHLTIKSSLIHLEGESRRRTIFKNHLKNLEQKVE